MASIETEAYHIGQSLRDEKLGFEDKARTWFEAIHGHRRRGLRAIQNPTFLSTV
jgi:hypothetical protein